MQQKLKTWDVLALGFMTFALFLGAGNIIFPPMVGLSSGAQLWSAALGFLLTGVGLPLLTVVALARVGGGMPALTAPLGKAAGIALGVAVYLSIGPLFATPRTATVSFAMGAAPFVGDTPANLLIFTSIYFALVLMLSLYPGKLMDNIGKIITPALILALAILGGTAFFLPAGTLTATTGNYVQHPLAEGFLQGYQTMDALGALVFGVVIVNAIKSQGIQDPRLHTRYAIAAGVIAALGLGLVYISLVYLGAHNAHLAPDASTGVQVLTSYVEHTFGAPGLWLLATVILLACLTTGVGLVSACGVYFSQLLPLSYRTVVTVVSIFSLGAANLGLTQLIAIAVPALYTTYPVAIALVTLNLISRLWRSPRRVFVPVLLVALLFGLVDGLKAADLQALIPPSLLTLPGAAMGLGWLLPVLVVGIVAAAADRLRPAPAAQPL